MSETMVFRFHSGQLLRASIEHEAALYYSLRDTAGNPLVVSRDRVREIVPLADVEPCPDAFSGAATDPGHSWDGDACALCGKSRPAEAALASDPPPGACVMNARDNEAMQALSDAGAQCGDCGDQPGDRICPDCERCYGWYVAALRKAGWAPRTEVLNQAADALEARVADVDVDTRTTWAGMDAAYLRHLAASPAAVPVPDETAGDETGEDFFQPGHTYQRRRWLFECLAVAPNPFDQETRAVGFLFRPGEPATATALDQDNWENDGWTEVADATNGGDQS